MKTALIGAAVAAAAMTALPSAAEARTYSSFSLYVGNGGTYDPYYDRGYDGYYNYPSYDYYPRYSWRDHDRWERRHWRDERRWDRERWRHRHWRDRDDDDD